MENLVQNAGSHSQSGILTSRISVLQVAVPTMLKPVMGLGEKVSLHT